jgi:hypothetical protein
VAIPKTIKSNEEISAIPARLGSEFFLESLMVALERRAGMWYVNIRQLGISSAITMNISRRM